jgi:hypothetical protein
MNLTRLCSSHSWPSHCARAIQVQHQAPQRPYRRDYPARVCRAPTLLRAVRKIDPRLKASQDRRGSRFACTDRIVCNRDELYLQLSDPRPALHTRGPEIMSIFKVQLKKAGSRPKHGKGSALHITSLPFETLPIGVISLHRRRRIRSLVPVALLALMKFAALAATGIRRRVRR